LRASESKRQEYYADNFIPIMNVSEKDTKGDYIVHKLSVSPIFVDGLLKNPKCREVINIPDAKGETFLHSMIKSGLPKSLNTIDVLIKAGVDINQKNGLGDSPLHTALACNNLDAMRRLLKHSITNVDQKNKNG